jgi:hypothetical protein
LISVLLLGRNKPYQDTFPETLLFSANDDGLPIGSLIVFQVMKNSNEKKLDGTVYITGNSRD